MKIIRRSLSLLELPAALKIWQWGEHNRRMGKNVTAKPGRYSADNFPYQREPQESFIDSQVQTTVLYWGKRLGKTEMINNLHGWVIETLQLNILVVYPTLDSAKKWSKQFFMPMVRTTQSLGRLLKKQRSRDSANTILSKEFDGGTTISAIGTNSVSGYRQVQAPVVTCDEIDAMEDGPEGDPITLSFGRAENYQNNIQVVASTATKIVPATDEEEMKGSRIHRWWLKSDQRKWFVPCPDCGAYHVMDDNPDWENHRLNNLKWPIVEIEKGIWEHKLEEAYYECPACKSHWDDYKRVQAIMGGEWRPTAKFTGIRGYWLNGFSTLFPAKKGFKTKLHQLASDFYDAAIGKDSEKLAWLNTFLCKPLEITAERIEVSPLLERREEYRPDALPNDIAVIIAAVDVQGNRLEVETIGLGDSDESWGIEWVKLIGDPEKDEVWEQLKNEITKKYKRTDGTELPITMTVIDLGHLPGRVRKFIKRCGLPRVHGVYGARKSQVNLVTAKHSKFYKMFSYSVATNLAKDTIFARLKLENPGRGYMHFPKSYEKDYFDGLTAEECKVKYFQGRPETYYEKIKGRRNEPLDLRVYWLAALDILRPNIEAIRKSLEKPAQPAKEYVLKPDTTEKPVAAVPPKRKRLSMKIGGVGRF
jgi:phage terminase large subunit GpA-like protein